MIKESEYKVDVYIKRNNCYCDECDSKLPLKYFKIRSKDDSELNEEEKEFKYGWCSKNPSPHPLCYIYHCINCGKEYIFDNKYPYEEIIYKEVK